MKLSIAVLMAFAANLPQISAMPQGIGANSYVFPILISLPPASKYSEY
jgi:hypothetical protein